MNFKLHQQPHFVRQMVREFERESVIMAVPRSKKKKKPPMHRPAKTPLEIVKMANYVNLAALVRTLWTVYGWREKRIAYFLEAHLALLQESTSFGVNQLIKDTEEMTGVDVKKLFDEVCEGKG